MYIENDGGDGDLKITVDGEEFTAEANYDQDHDGVDDTAMVQTDDGYLAYTDTDHDGDADVLTMLDRQGRVVGQARFDASSGQWVDTGKAGGGGDHRETASRDGSAMVVETRDGERTVGPATEDLNQDGKADTTVVRDDDGDVILFTDTDGDGDADAATEISKDGKVTIREHQGHGDWKVVEQGHINKDGTYSKDAFSGNDADDAGDAGDAADPAGDAAWSDAAWSESGTAPAGTGSTGGSAVSVDPVTGRWI
ncbi:hypothetical protein LX15_005662 [Streptoalloteichus tenebrarius]|uniref:DUF6802 domain-containing protein n=1 Tax=Streptoalloteichus tenebrarius (strain ATCC 17920 / DSM 40477 / JCM 4838 / CBS 697.72 / NBRC 16177 / NCIMB 11028 / NRRL B-12390 / A12253. 1 / ISP 5477) TaxID=1933 RepID=A0ABT1I2X9_STRSD|nr:DUF6802 family protein [Streptoalloteichus tenebrarius]MCP2261935.1 hypothetical protein [Streptoalloteichus tenebrarius]BFF02072.1 hypothetical protein GCM10020241_37470 [Streptoalloteichus tenebrarius]